jgi:phosphatidylserine decarboxylase
MAARPLPLPLWDRKAGKLVQEFMDDAPSTYESRPRRSLNQWLESHPLYDWLLAAYQNSRFSARKIGPFIRKHHIDMGEFEPVTYRSYAEFFERRFRLGVRPFPAEPASMGAFAEARYLAWERVDETQEFPIKGRSLDAAQILGSPSRARDFAGGPVILARLSPMDYHHVHYPDHGRTLGSDRIGGRLWTVNWHALLNSRSARCRSAASCRCILPTSRSNAVQKNQSSALADRPSRSLGKQVDGVPRPTCCKTPRRASRPCCAWAKSWHVPLRCQVSPRTEPCPAERLFRLRRCRNPFPQTRVFPSAQSRMH